MGLLSNLSKISNSTTNLVVGSVDGVANTAINVIKMGELNSQDALEETATEVLRNRMKRVQDSAEDLAAYGKIDKALIAQYEATMALLTGREL